MPQRPPKHDFSGDTKNTNPNSDKYDYDADWVFHNGAWMTRRQRRRAVRDEREARQYRRQINNPQRANAPAAPTTTVPIFPTNPTSETTPPATTTTPPVPQAGAASVPPWWINAAIQNPTTPDQQFANVANAILPTLSPEDQRTLGNYLATNFKDVYGGYANAQFPQAPTEITADIRNSYLNPQRAQRALNLLERMRQASGAQNMGAGYDFLKNAVKLMNQFATGGVMTREKYLQFQNAVAALNKNATGDLSAYANLSQLFNLPSFTAGPLVSNTPNDNLFT